MKSCRCGWLCSAPPCLGTHAASGWGTVAPQPWKHTPSWKQEADQLPWGTFPRMPASLPAQPSARHRSSFRPPRQLLETGCVTYTGNSPDRHSVSCECMAALPESGSLSLLSCRSEAAAGQALPSAFLVLGKCRCSGHSLPCVCESGSCRDGPACTCMVTNSGAAR